MKKIKVLAIAGIFTASLAATAFAEMADVKIGGEIRVRAENVKTDGASGDGQYLQRTRINVDAKVNETTKAYIQLQDSRTWGSDGTTTGLGTANENEAVDVSQAYFQLDKLADQPLSLRVGRQALSYGDQRLVGGLEWSNFARRFDALKLVYNTDAFSVDLWTAKVVEAIPASDADRDFNGIYATVKSVPNNTIDLYLLQDKAGKNAAAPADRDVLTYGLRVAGKAADLDYTGEFALQTGDNSAGVDQESSAYALKAGYTIPAVMGLRIGAEYDFASGDDAGTENKDFQNLYPTNHYLYGYNDDITWKNIQAMSLNVSVKPADNLSVAAEYWAYTEAEKVGTGDDAGTELNLLAKYTLNANVKLEAAYVMRTAGDDATADYLGTAGAIAKDDSSTFTYLQANVTF